MDRSASDYAVLNSFNSRLNDTSRSAREPLPNRKKFRMAGGPGDKPVSKDRGIVGLEMVQAGWRVRKHPDFDIVTNLDDLRHFLSLCLEDGGFN
jgi:hypothetical protein